MNYVREKRVMLTELLRSRFSKISRRPIRDILMRLVHFAHFPILLGNVVLRQCVLLDVSEVAQWVF